jgi:hypothetical protein
MRTPHTRIGGHKVILVTRRHQSARGLARDQTEASWLMRPSERVGRRRRKKTLIESLFQWIRVPTGKVRRRRSR